MKAIPPSVPDFAVCISHYSIGNSPSLLNLLGLLATHFQVHLFLDNVALCDVPLLQSPRFVIYSIGRCFRRMGWPHPARHLRPQHFLAVDPHGLVLCKELFPEARPIYYSLELYLRDDHYGLDYPPAIMRRERAAMKDIAGLVIQSAEKRDLFIADHGCGEGLRTFLLPVTLAGPPRPGKSRFVRDTFRIPPTRNIALHLGGIATWFSCIEIAIAFGALDDWALLFQGYADPRYKAELKTAIRDHRLGNVFVSDVTYADIGFIDRIVESCDAGIAWYNDISAGFRTAGQSSGKIVSYLRGGLPVVAKAYPSTLRAIEAAGCGRCVSSIDDIPQALSTIQAAYDTFSSCALREYDATYRFDRYERALLDFLTASV